MAAVDSRKSEHIFDRHRESSSRTGHDRKPAQVLGKRSWQPETVLLPHVDAPLACRVSLPPLTKSLPQALEPTPLSQLNSSEQERAILDDLLYVLLGYEGQYIRYENEYNPNDQKARLSGPTYRILPGLDPTLAALSKRILACARHHVVVEAFVDIMGKEEYGLITHALVAAVRLQLKDFMVLIAQIETEVLSNPKFSLHLFQLHLMPTGHNMAQLAGIAREMFRKNNLLEELVEEESDDDLDVDNLIERLKEKGQFAPGSNQAKIYKGGNVLRLLTTRMDLYAGDPAARRLLKELLNAASRPYMTMLNEWLHRGNIQDPHGEFLIRQQKSIRRENLNEDFTDEYWEKRYTIREDSVPPHLEAVKDKVLLAGKYLNVVRECGGVDVSKEVEDVPLTLEDPRFLNNITGAYSHANYSLLNLLLTTHELPARLQSLKHYFFLDRSDFFTHFLYLANSELRKPSREINLSKLQSLLDLVLRQPGSIAASDPYKEDVRVFMNDQVLYKFLMSVVNVKGFEEGAEDLGRPTSSNTKPDEESTKMDGFAALELKYNVPFPLSLVISSKTVVRYQILFRYLVSMRHLESLLAQSWSDHVKVVSWLHKSKDPRLESWKRKAWNLRARMLNFVQQMMYYVTSEVIEPNWNALMAKVNKLGKDVVQLQKEDNHLAAMFDGRSRTVDELMEDHVDFLDSCLKECMLMNAKLLKLHDKLTTCCTMFARYTTILSQSLCSADPSLVGTKAAKEYLESEYPNPRRPIPDRLKTFDPDAIPKMVEMLDKYEENFNRHLKILLDALDYYAATETVALSRLCAQLSLTSEKDREERFLS